jgi:hypothetical protein
MILPKLFSKFHPTPNPFTSSLTRNPRQLPSIGPEHFSSILPTFRTLKVPFARGLFGS